jgi:hypothetical protein
MNICRLRQGGISKKKGGGHIYSVLMNTIYQLAFPIKHVSCVLCSVIKKVETLILLDSKGIWRWCITLRITGFLDFSHRPVF